MKFVHSFHTHFRSRTTFYLYTMSKVESLQSKELKFYMLLHLEQSNEKKKIRQKLCCDNSCSSVVTGMCHRYLDIKCDLSGHANIPGKVLEQSAPKILQQHLETFMC